MSMKYCNYYVEKDTNYIIMTGETYLELARQVNEAMIDGWYPIGGVAVQDSGNPMHIRFLQAMVRETNENNQDRDTR